MADVPFTLGQLGTILFFGGFSWWAIRWSGRNLRAQIGSSRPKSRDARESLLSAEEVQAVVSHRLASPADLFSMSPAEQRLLAQTAMAMAAPKTAPAAPEAPPRAFCPSCGTPVENWPERVPWHCTCIECGSEIVLRRDGKRWILSYTPPAA